MKRKEDLNGRARHEEKAELWETIGAMLEVRNIRSGNPNSGEKSAETLGRNV